MSSFRTCSFSAVINQFCNDVVASACMQIAGSVFLTRIDSVKL